MSLGGLTIIDGTQLKAAALSLPPSTEVVTGAEILELAQKQSSACLYGVVLPETLKSSALHRLGISDYAAFNAVELDSDNASSTLTNYISAIADQLRDDPIVVAILDGKVLHMFLEDEDDFAMLAENLFTDLDTEDRGKIPKNQMQNALDYMGVEMGIPPVSEFPQFNHILERHGAEGKEELGQAQFAQLLQSVLQEVADNLAKKNVIIVQNIKAANGSKIRKLLSDNGQLSNPVEKIMNEYKNDKPNTIIIRSFLEEQGVDLGLPPQEVAETAVLFEEVFNEVNSQIDCTKGDKDEISGLLHNILEKFAEKLEANLILYDPLDT